MTVRLVFACDGARCTAHVIRTLEAFQLDSSKAMGDLELAGWTFKKHQRAPRIRALCPQCAVGDKR